jgi:hypothetical protein
MPKPTDENEDAAVAEANRRMTPSERDDTGEQLPDADDAVTRANQRIARPQEERSDPLRTDAVTLIPPD